jgi:hypothetical protein
MNVKTTIVEDIRTMIWVCCTNGTKTSIYGHHKVGEGREDQDEAR